MQRPKLSCSPGKFRKENAEIVALQVLRFLAGEEDGLAALCAASGLSPAELRTRASDPDFLAAILDFLLEDEQRLLAFCAWADLPPEAPAQARRALPGGASFEF